MKRIFQKREQRPLVPFVFGKYYPDWTFTRQHGERNCDGMNKIGSMFDPENGAWVMCTRKAKHKDESSGLQFCAQHMKRQPPYTCTHVQAIEIQAERANIWEGTKDLLRAGQERSFLKSLNKQEKQVEKDIKKEWGKALDWLSKAVANALECWVATLPYYKGNRSEPGITLHLLHGQACKLSRAIVGYCKWGEIQSAVALWHSLFEIEVNLAFIAKDTTQKPSRAERFEDWSMANYFIVNNLRPHERMIDLQRKYRNWGLGNHDGWTAPTDNPKAILGLTKRALQVGYSLGDKQIGQYSKPDIYNLCHSYVHTNMIAMLNDPLTSARTVFDDRSPFDLDTMLCMTASSLANITPIFLENHQGPENEGKLSDFKRLAEIQESQVNLEVAMVRPDVLSPFRGVDLSFTVRSDDGTEYDARPARRGEP